MVETTVLGISVQEGSGNPVLLLFPHNTTKILPLKVGALEAFAISSALAEMERPHIDEKGAPASSTDAKHDIGSDATELFSRPLMHQLLQKSIDSLGGHLLAVELSMPKNGRLESTLVLQSHSGEERLDCRPSDGIALAIRCGAKVRVSSEIAGLSEDIDSTMSTLSEDLRTIVAAKLLSMHEDQALAPIRDALLYSALKTTRGRIRKSMVDISRQIVKQSRDGGSLEKALAEVGAKLVPSGVTNPAQPLENSTLPARKTPPLPAPRPIMETDAVLPKPVENDDGSTTMEAVVTPGQTIVLPSPHGGGKASTIRISLVRQTNDGSPEALDEQLFPAAGIAKEALGGLSLSRDEVKAVGNALSEDDRLTTLLRLLSPETKVPM